MVNTAATSASDRILEAAKRVFLLKGMAGARMQDIADEAGMNKAMLHYYFRNKEKLFDVIFREASSQFFPRIQSILDSELSLEEKIRKFCSEYIDLCLKNPYLPLFLLNEVNSKPEGFIKKLWKNKDSPFSQFSKAIAAASPGLHIQPGQAAHIFINMLSMCIFPCIARPIWMAANDMDESQFMRFMEQRKTEVPRFIIASITK